MYREYYSANFQRLKFRLLDKQTNRLPPFDELALRLRTAGLCYLLAVGIAVFCLLVPAARAASTPVPIPFTVSAAYQNPVDETVTGSISVNVAGSSVQESMEVSEYIPRHTVGSATAMMVIDRPYSYSAGFLWNYQWSSIEFTDMGCYWIEMYDRETPPNLVNIVNASNPNIYFDGSGSEDFQIYLRSLPVSFDDSCKCQESDFPQLIADGQSQIEAWVVGKTSLTWGFDGDPLDCKIESILNGDKARITAGRKGGSVTVLATASDGCVFKGVLALVCAEETCSSGQCSDFGNGSAKNNSVDLTIGLGGDSCESIGGYITLKASAPSSDLGMPKSLAVIRLGENVTWIWNGDGLRQVHTPLGLVNIVTNSNYEYNLSFYPASALGGITNGLYTLIPNPQAIVIWTVEFPGGESDTNHVQITETRSGLSITNLYTWIVANNGWQLDRGNYLSRETRIAVWNIGNTIRTETLRTYNSTNGSLVAVNTNVYQVYTWGEALTRRTSGQDGSAQTTTYTRDANGVLQEVVYPNSSWEKYVYNGQGNVGNKYSAFGNQGPTTDASLCRVTDYSYTPVGTGDDGTVKALLPRKLTEKVQNHIVSLGYAVYQPALDIQIRCVRTNALWNDSDNLYTTNRYDSLGRLTNSVSPDGTLQVFVFAYNSVNTRLTNTVYVGQPNGGWTSVIDGMKTVTITGSVGELISRTNIDIASGIVLSSENYTYNDDLNRSYTVIYLDGTSNTVSYACCGIDTTIDRDGVITQYSYDTLKRQVASISLSISTTNILDAAGHVLATKRIGSDASPINLRRVAYDLAGVPLFETNALNGVTTFTNITDSFGQTVKTNIYADGGTRIETYFKDGALAKITGTAASPVRYDYGVESEGGVYRPYSKEIKLDASLADTSEWTKTYTDLLGRSYKTIYASSSGTPTSQSFFNNYGQLWKTVDPDLVTNLFGYNAKGEQEFTAIDLDNNGQINTNTIDRVTRTVSDAITNSVLSADIRRTRTYTWAANNDTTATLVSTAETSVDGLKTWNTIWNKGVGVTNKAQNVYAGNGNRYVTNTAPDGSYTVSLYQYGLLSSVTRMDSGNTPIAKTTYAHDAHGRQSSATDARNGTTTYTFNNADQVLTTTTPSPGSGQSPQTSTSYYDNLGRLTGQLLADNTSVTNEYHPTGQLRRTYGSRAYPVGYGYDSQGRMKTMTNWSGFPSTGTRVTTWNYDGYRGFLTNKVYDGNSAGPSYTYTAAGRLLTRAWVRGTNTAYAYNKGGDLSGVDYSDSTTDVAYGYDRRGRRTVITNGTAICTLTYNDASQLLVETNSGGTLNGLALTNAYDTLLRRSAVALKTQPSTLIQFGYDNASRLSSVTNGVNSATYAYLANSPLVSEVVFKTNSTTRMTTARQFDLLNRLQQISSAPGAVGVSPISFGYSYNLGNQRTRGTAADGSYWVYDYDSLGQVKRGAKFFNDGCPVPGQQFEYAFDDIGNRTSTKAGGDENGAGLRPASYTVNNLNQYSQRDVPGAVDVMGLALGTNSTLTVNSQTPWRKGEYFRKELSVANSSAAVWQSVSVAATGETTVSGNVFVPKTPEAFYYDLDGNLTNDGRWTYTWDAENRLVNMTSASSAPTGSKLKLDFTYDWQGRRIQKTVSTNNGSIYVAQYTNRFVYDGWNLLAVLDPNASVIRSFVWGLDLSGSLQGAGGVGGLLIVNDVSNGVHFPAYDGNGNVAALVKSDGTISAQYEYGPFGEALRATGLMAKANPFRFSTKYQDDETDLLYYGYRYYSPSMGRWISRDPIAEIGGENLYAMVRNNPILNTDLFGLTVHLSPFNDLIYNFSSYDVYIRGDWIEVDMYHAGHPDPSRYTAYPWSEWQYWKLIYDPPPGEHHIEVREGGGSHTLAPGHDSAGDWSADLTRIVDADFLTGASVPVYKDIMCRQRVKGMVKVGITLVLSVHDCPTGCPGVFYSGGREY